MDFHLFKSSIQTQDVSYSFHLKIALFFQYIILASFSLLLRAANTIFLNSVNNTPLAE